MACNVYRVLVINTLHACQLIMLRLEIPNFVSSFFVSSSRQTISANISGNKSIGTAYGHYSKSYSVLCMFGSLFMSRLYVKVIINCS